MHDPRYATPAWARQTTQAGQFLRHTRIEDAPPYPAPAANLGIEMAQADLVGLLLDGARMASPGLCAHALLAHCPALTGVGGWIAALGVGVAASLICRRK